MRIRHTALTAVLGLALLSAAACAPPAPPRTVAQADSIVTPLTRATPLDSVTLAPVPSYAFALSRADSVAVPAAQAIASTGHDAPAPSPRPPLSPLIAFAAVGATKRKSRRDKGVKIPEVPLYLDSDVHVMRDGQLSVVRGGQLIDDTDLEDEEIEELKHHKVVRPASAAELAGLEQQAAGDAAAELAARHAEDRAKLVASHEQEVSEAKAAGKSDAQIARLQEKHASQVAALDEQQAAEKAAQEAGA